MKEKIVELICFETKLAGEKVEEMIEIPPQVEMGDFAFPVFTLSKELKKNPIEIAKELTEKLRKKIPEGVSNVENKGSYVNFYLDKKVLSKRVLGEVKKKDWGKNDSGKGKTIVVDLSAPNIAKPFGIGHLRSTIIGNAISNIARMNGYKTVKINYLGDWGTQFGKLILAYKKWGNEKKLEEDAIKHLQELYVRINIDESLEDEARAEFKKLEEGDKENLEMWKKFKDLSMNEFNRIYEILGVDFDVISGESKYNDKMDSVIELLKEKSLIKRDDGAEIVDLQDENLGVALIKKSDGTSLYVTRDLAAIIDRKEKYNFDKIIYEVGQEQTLHFKQLFKILEKLGFEWHKDCKHVAHGLYLGKDGKKFSTRKGKTVLMNEILEEVIDKAKKNLSERDKLSEEELQKRSVKIALAAIFYGDLKNSPENNIIFDVERFLSFEGDTGPYLLYSYARANSIIKKAKSKKALKIIDLNDAEIKLIKKIDEFPTAVKSAFEKLAPNLIANYSFELAQIFNEFYHECPVMGSDEEGFRLKLVDAFRVTLGKSLNLLGIDVLDEM